ncbi:MAG: translocation/assembly module TamB domain-containing protein, partial [Myxococcota bacterium]
LIENFLLPRPSSPPLPIRDYLARVGFSDIDLEIRLRIQELIYEADIMTYPMRAPVQGDLRLFQSLLHPAVEGALHVTEGQLTFPSARFELTDSSIDFNPEDKGIEPVVALVARSEFAPEHTGCESDLPVLLSIQGRSSSAYELQLSAEDGTEHSRLELLMSALFGQRLSLCEAERGIGDPTDAAVRAFTGQILNQTLTADLESSVRSAIGGDLQIKVFMDTNQVATDVRWQLGRRLALEGGAPLYQWNAVEKGVSQQADVSELGNLRLRLLWLDHVPPFEGDISFETVFSGQRDAITGASEPVTRGQFRYRVLEY